MSQVTPDDRRARRRNDPVERVVERRANQLVIRLEDDEAAPDGCCFTSMTRAPERRRRDDPAPARARLAARRRMRLGDDRRVVGHVDDRPLVVGDPEPPPRSTCRARCLGFSAATKSIITRAAARAARSCVSASRCGRAPRRRGARTAAASRRMATAVATGIPNLLCSRPVEMWDASRRRRRIDPQATPPRVPWLFAMASMRASSRATRR